MLLLVANETKIDKMALQGSNASTDADGLTNSEDHDQLRCSR